MKSSAFVFALYFAFAYGSSPPTKHHSYVALLAVSEKDGTEITALENDLEMIGVPYETTHAVNTAVRAPMIVLAGTLTNTTLSAAGRERLYAYVESGGVLFATHVQGSQFFPLFGVAGFSTSREDHAVHFVDSTSDAALHYINRPEERDIVLGDAHRYREINWTTHYRLAGAVALGKFPKGAAAFIRNHYGRGIAYSLGLSFSDSTLRMALGQNYEAEPAWANVFAPAADVLRMLLRAIYEANVHPFVLIHTIPDGFESALLLSHDIDARESFRNSVAFADMEQRYGATSTFFVTTKYFDDATDSGYYTPGNCAYLRQVFARGFDLGSHTVSHLKTFNRFPAGETPIRFTAYKPTETPTVFGEIEVSKELLDRDIAGQHTIAFRAGELSHPPQLIQSLEIAGYLVDSTRAAGSTLTNYAYRPLGEVHLGSPVSSMIEVPVTLDDSMGYLTPATLERTVKQWLDIITANAENNNITCLLIHPTDTTYKLNAEERLLQACHQKPIWTGSVTRFGLFARARASIRATVFGGADHLVIELNKTRSELPRGLTLVIEPTAHRTTIAVRDGDGADVPFITTIKPERTLLILRP